LSKSFKAFLKSFKAFLKSFKASQRASELLKELQSFSKSFKASQRASKLLKELQSFSKSFKASKKALKPSRSSKLTRNSTNTHQSSQKLPRKSDFSGCASFLTLTFHLSFAKIFDLLTYRFLLSFRINLNCFTPLGWKEVLKQRET
jgi:hypothetical protein